MSDTALFLNVLGCSLLVDGGCVPTGPISAGDIFQVAVGFVCVLLGSVVDRLRKGRKK